MTDLELLQRAVRLASEHSRKGTNGPFGAVVARHGEVVGEGWNRVVEDHDPTAHAEILAIRDAARRLGTHVLSDCTIYCSCEPCPMCLAAIYWASIPRVVFAADGEDAALAGFDDTRIAQEISLTWEEREVESEQGLREDGQDVFEAWLSNPGRVEY
jgi:tRNA(Arg) A34 adenosine deaminase TadA